MTNHNQRLTKLEETPAVQRLGLIKDFSLEELQALATLRDKVCQLKDRSPLSLFEGLIEEADRHIAIVARGKVGTSIKVGVPDARCGDYFIHFEVEYHADEFTQLDRLHKAMLAAGCDPLAELTRVANEWETENGQPTDLD